MSDYPDSLRQMVRLNYVDFDELTAAATHIEQLEAALRLTRPYIEMHTLSPNGTMATILAKIDAALFNLCEDEGCPNAGTPHVCINRQEDDTRWAVNVLLEQIAAKFEAWDTFDIWRSEAASTVRSFKHVLDQSSPPARQENDDVFKGFRGNNEA